MTEKLTVGSKAPSFDLLDQDENRIQLKDFKGKKLLLYFYPKADTPGCTTQSCEVRDALPQFNDLNTAVAGVSPDAPSAQKKFDAKFTFGFPLLCDTEKKMAQDYGVWGEKSLYGKKYMGIVRSAFLIDEKGIIEAALYKISPKKTVPEILKVLQA